MPTFRDIVGYRPSQARRILRQLNNQLTPSPSRQSQPSQPSQPLFPGGQIRELWNLPHTPAPPSPNPAPSSPPEDFCETGPGPLAEHDHANTPYCSQLAPDPQPQVEIDPPLAAFDPEPQGLGSRILRAVWAPKAVPPHPGMKAESSGGRSLPVTAGLPVGRHGFSSDMKAGPLGGRSFSSDLEPVPLSGVSTPEVSHPSKRRRSKRPRTRKKPVCLHPNETPEITEKGDITLAHHSARCSICNHPDRDAIEQAFLHWTRPSVIAYEFNLGSRLAIYRHAHALGLFHRRNLQTQHALGYLVEQAQSVKPTADSIIRAVKALSCFDDAGRYHEPRKEVLITHQVVTVTTPACPEAATSSPTLPAHSYSIAPVGTGDSPIHLKLDANLIDTHDEQNADPTRIGVLSVAPRSEGSRRQQPIHRNAPPSADLIDTDDEQNSPLTPIDPVT